jgi:hypothetical protein
VVWHKRIAEHLNGIGKRLKIITEDGEEAHVYTDEDIHYIMKAKFLGMEKCKIGARVIERPRSSRKLDHAAFCYWMTQIEEMVFTYYDLVLEVQANDQYSMYKEAQLK